MNFDDFEETFPISDDLGTCPKCGADLIISQRGRLRYECSNPMCDYSSYLSRKQKKIKPIKIKKERSKGKFLFEQANYVERMAPIVFEVVKWYVKNNPGIDYSRLEKVFSNEVIDLIPFHYSNEPYVIELAYGQIIRVKRQWNELSFDSFIRLAKRIGLTIVRFDNSQEKLFIDYLKNDKKLEEGTAKTYASHIWQIQKHYRETHGNGFLFFESTKADADIIIQIIKDYKGDKYHSFMNVNYCSALNAYINFWAKCIYENN